MEPIVINGREEILSVAVLIDGKHFVSGDEKGKIRRWCIEGGKEVGTPMHAGSCVVDITVSRDGKVIVSGTNNGRVIVWNAKSRSKVTAFKAHTGWVFAVHISPDATKIVTGSADHTACVWSLSTGKRLLSWKHDRSVLAAKFSPDGRLIATATWDHSVRVHDSQNGILLVEFPVKVDSSYNHSLAWASDSKQLFAIAQDSYIHRVDVSTRIMLSKWHIHGSSDKPTTIALAGNGTFITASTRSSVSFWDTTSEEQIGTVIEYTHDIASVDMSPDYDLVIGGGEGITLRTLCGILPSHYLNNVSVTA